MRIIHFISAIDKSGGGITTYIKLLAEELTKLNVNQRIFTGHSKNPVEIEGVGVDFFNLKNLAPYQLKRVIQLRKVISNYLINQKPDIVHINGIWLYQNYVFQKEAQKLGIKVILSPHGMMEPYIMNSNPIKKKIALLLYQNSALKKVDYFHSTAQSELNNIRNYGYMKPCVVISNGIKIDNINTKEKFNLGNCRHLLFLSRVHPKKGINLLIEAVSELNYKNIKITIAGNGDLKYVTKLIELTKSKGVESIFNFVGPLYENEKEKMFLTADVFILPTHSENFGIVVAESLLFGIPVVTTQGTPWEELNIKKCGWWIELTVEKLKETLVDVLNTSSEELKVMGLRGRDLIRTNYDIKSVAISMKQFYLSIYK